MGFFEELERACVEQNAHLDELLARQEAEAAAVKTREETEEKIRRRNWAVGVLEAGNMPLQQVNRIAAAMKIVVTDSEVPCTRVEQLFLKHEHYRPVIYQSVVENFLERGGDPAGELGTYCIKRALSLEPGVDLFNGDTAQSLAMGLLILGRFNGDKRSAIAGAYELLRKKFPFTKQGNLQALPHKIGTQLYPEHYRDGECLYRFARPHDNGAARKIAKNGKSHRWRGEKDEDPEITEALEQAAKGKFSGIRLIRTGTD